MGRTDAFWEVCSCCGNELSSPRELFWGTKGTFEDLPLCETCSLAWGEDDSLFDLLEVTDDDDAEDDLDSGTD